MFSYSIRYDARDSILKYFSETGAAFGALASMLPAEARWAWTARALRELRRACRDRSNRRAIAHHWATAARAAALAAACAGCASTPSSKPVATACGVARAACAVVEAACGVAETSGGATP